METRVDEYMFKYIDNLNSRVAHDLEIDKDYTVMIVTEDVNGNRSNVVTNKGKIRGNIVAQPAPSIIVDRFTSDLHEGHHIQANVTSSVYFSTFYLSSFQDNLSYFLINNIFDFINHSNKFVQISNIINGYDEFGVDVPMYINANVNTFISNLEHYTISNSNIFFYDYETGIDLTRNSYFMLHTLNDSPHETMSNIISIQNASSNIGISISKVDKFDKDFSANISFDVRREITTGLSNIVYYVSAFPNVENYETNLQTNGLFKYELQTNPIIKDEFAMPVGESFRTVTLNINKYYANIDATESNIEFNYDNDYDVFIRVFDKDSGERTNVHHIMVTSKRVPLLYDSADSSATLVEYVRENKSIEANVNQYILDQSNLDVYVTFIKQGNHDENQIKRFVTGNSTHYDNYGIVDQINTDTIRIYRNQVPFNEKWELPNFKFGYIASNIYNPMDYEPINIATEGNIVMYIIDEFGASSIFYTPVSNAGVSDAVSSSIEVVRARDDGFVLRSINASSDMPHYVMVFDDIQQENMFIGNNLKTFKTIANIIQDDTTFRITTYYDAIFTSNSIQNNTSYYIYAYAENVESGIFDLANIEATAVSIPEITYIHINFD